MVETSATIKLNAVDNNLTATVNDVSAKVTNAQIATTGLNLAFKGLNKASATTTAELAIGARSANTLATGFNQAAKATGVFVRAIAPVSNSIFLIQQAAIAADGLRKAYLEVARIPQTLRAVQASGISTQIIQDFGNLQEAIKGNEQALDSLVTNAIAKLGKFEAAAARAGTILRSSTRFDEQGNALRADTEERLQNALQAQKLVNTELKNAVSSTEALNGQYEVLSSGFTKAAESQKVLTSGLKLVSIAEAGGQRADAGETLRLLTKTLNAYEQGADQAASTTAKLNAVVENGLTTIQELSLVFGRTSKQAAQANINLNETGAAIAVLTSQGISTPEAGTGIARIAANIIDKTPEAEKALAKLQLNGERIRFDKAEIGAKGFTQALIDLNEAAGGSPEILSAIFPEDVAFRTVNALLAERGKKLANIRDEIAKADSTSLEEVSEIATSNRTKRFERIVNRLEESIIKIGLQLVPALEPGIKALEGVANGFERLPEGVKQFIGNLLVLQIKSKAYGNAAKILIGTLAALAGNYLLVRTISLALTGQLGKEIGVIKDLIVKRKNLGAATLQLFGINQKWRLAEVATTEALVKQSKLTSAIAEGRKKAAEVTKGAFSTAATRVGSLTTGLDQQKAKEQVDKTKEQVGKTFEQTKKQVVEQGKNAISKAGTSVIARTQEITTAVIKKGKEKINQITDDLEVAPFFPTVQPEPPKPKPVLALPPARPLPPKPPVIASPVGGFSFIDRQQQIAAAPPERVLVTPPPAVAPGTPVGAFGLGVQKPTRPKSSEVLEFLVGKDEEVNRKLAKQTELENKLTEAKVERRKKFKRIGGLREKQDKAEIKLTEAKNKVVRLGNDINATAEQRQKAILAVQKQQQKLDLISQDLDIAGLELNQARTKAKYAQNNAEAALTKTEAARTAARKKYGLLSVALVESEQANAKATLLSQQATIAKYKAEQIAIAQGVSSQAAIKANTAAKKLETLATEAQTVAESKAAIAKKLQDRLTLKQQLAEQGLYETKLFGNKVRLSEVGIIGAINKALTVNIGLTKLKILSEKALNKVLLFGRNLLDIRNLQIAKQNLLLAVSDVKSFATTIGNLFKSGATKISGGVSAISKSLGVLSPLLAVAAFGAIAFRDELFGLGRASRQLQREYNQLTEAQEKLADSLGKRVAIARANRALQAGNLEGVGQELITLQKRGLITTNQFNSLASKLADVGLKKGDIKALRKEINQLIADSKDIETGVTDKIGSFIKGIPGGIGKAIGWSVDSLVNQGAGLLANVVKNAPALVGLGRFEIITPKDIAEAREVDALIKPLSILSNLQAEIGDRTIITKEALRDYRTELALIPEVAAKVKGGFTLTEEDLKLEESAFNDRIKLNNEQISKAEKIIKSSEDKLTKTKKEEQQKRLKDKIFETQQLKKYLEEQNEDLQKARSQVKKYLTEELPAIRRALQEQARPDLLLQNARENFAQVFVDDSDVILKPLAKLREEAFKLVSSIQESLELGILDQPGQPGELAASAELRKIRDEEIEFYEDGELKRGYRLTLEQRKELSQLIANLENSDLQRQQQARNLEISKIKQLNSFKILSSVETNKKIAKLQLESTENAIAQKVSEIQELKELGVRTLQQQAELDKLKQQREADRLNVELSNIQSEEERRTGLIRDLTIARIRQLGELQLTANTEVNRKVSQLEVQAIDQRIAEKEREIQKRKDFEFEAIDEQVKLEELRNERQRLIDDKASQEQIDDIDRQIAEKTKQIDKIKELGATAVDDDIELQKLALQRRKAIYQAELSEIEARLAKENLLRQKQSAIVQQIIFESKEKIVSIRAEKILNDELLSQYNLQGTAVNNIVRLQRNISTNNVFNAKQQANLSRFQLKQTKDTIPLQQKTLDIESNITKEQNKQALLQAQQQKAEAKFALTRLQERKKLAIENEADKQKLEELNLQIEAQELQIEQADSQIKQAEFRLNIEDNLIDNKQRQFDLTQQEKIANAELTISTSQRAIAESEITRLYNSRNFAISNQLGFLQLEKKTLSDKANFRTEELSLASQLTNSEVKKQRLARNIATIKLNSLSTQLKLEAEILAFNQQQEQIQLRREKSLNQAALQQNLADIISAQAKVQEVKAGGGTKAEIAAADAALQAQFAQRQSLQFQSEQLRLRDRLLEAQQQQAIQSFEKQSQLQITQARVEAIQTLPEGQRERLSKQIYRELVGSADVILPNLNSAIQNAGQINIEVPKLNIPELKFPDIEEIKKDVKAIVSEFKVEGNQGKQLNISTLQLEAPISITVTGEDSDEIAGKVEARIFEGLSNTIRNLDLDD